MPTSPPAGRWGCRACECIRKLNPGVKADVIGLDEEAQKHQVRLLKGLILVICPRRLMVIVNRTTGIISTESAYQVG
jgi:hypothetical protein